LEKYRVTHASLVPPIVIALAKHPLVNQYNLSLKRVGCGMCACAVVCACAVLCACAVGLTCLRAGAGAAALGDGVAKIVEKKFGCVLRQGYGMTELSPVATMSSLRKPVRRTTRHSTHTRSPHDTHHAHHTA
jgi:acyl-CoA synthetase (AMP-forming)/AMP-acid ligase II